MTVDKEKIKDIILDSIFRLFFNEKSNLRCFLILFGIGLFLFLFSISVKNAVESFFNLSPYWDEKMMFDMNKVDMILFLLNMLYMVASTMFFCKYIFSEEKHVD